MCLTSMTLRSLTPMSHSHSTGLPPLIWNEDHYLGQLAKDILSLQLPQFQIEHTLGLPWEEQCRQCVEYVSEFQGPAHRILPQRCAPFRTSGHVMHNWRKCALFRTLDYLIWCVYVYTCIMCIHLFARSFLRYALFRVFRLRCMYVTTTSHECVLYSDDA